ncbi:Ku protein [Candidatus Parcubacteria bacterium]|nr:Ku protein [Candidatus Parcubacteria bacterium]
MRAIWTGAISFGLVNIPVRLYSASEERELKFHLLHKEDLSPIRYAKVCRHEGKEIAYEDIVKGFEYEKGDYVILEDEDFKKANVRKTKTVDIYDFVDGEEIDSKYYDAPYFLEPGTAAAKPYALLREALKKSGKVGIGKFVLRSKEILVAIKPEGKILVLNKLRFESELRKPEGLKLPEKDDVKDKEVELALKLIDQLSGPFDPKKYKDEYTSDLKEVIEEKAHGKRVHVKGTEPVPTRVVDLMSVLRESLDREKEKTVK